jgi:hypothetical protein
VVPFANRLHKPLVVSGGRERLWPVLQFLSEQTCSGGTDLFASVKEFMGNFVMQGIVIVISDFFDEQGAERAVEMLRSAGHDFVLVQVHSLEEQRPTVAGEMILEDVETGSQRTVECSPQSAAIYEKRFLEFSDRLRRLALRNGGRYARAVTSVPYQEFVLRSLRSGQVLA